MQKHSFQAPEQNDWQEFKPLFGGGKIKICDTLRAVTPFGGLSVLIEFLGRIGLVEQLQSQELPAQKSQLLPTGPDPCGLHVERHCRSAAFCSCQPVASRPCFTRPAWIEALSQ